MLKAYETQGKRKNNKIHRKKLKYALEMHVYEDTTFKLCLAPTDCMWPMHASMWLILLFKSERNWLKERLVRAISTSFRLVFGQPLRRAAWLQCHCAPFSCGPCVHSEMVQPARDHIDVMIQTRMILVHEWHNGIVSREGRENTPVLHPSRLRPRIRSTSTCCYRSSNARVWFINARVWFKLSRARERISSINAWMCMTPHTYRQLHALPNHLVNTRKLALMASCRRKLYVNFRAKRMIS